MNKMQELTKILKRLNQGESPEKVKVEAKEFLATVDAKDLSIAEQNLIDEGLSSADLQKLCDIHLELLSDQVGKMKDRLPSGHVVSTLVNEHEAILGFLDTLDSVNEAIQQMDAYDGKADEFVKLSHVAEHLLEAERHHQREEDVLFPALEARGVQGPPTIMRQEHTQLRKQKHRLKDLADHAATLEFGRFKEQLNETVSLLAPALREHIFKENNVLYPTALQVIKDEELWQKLKAACDKIGYCCFTPPS
jgi:uncharacterized protein